MEKQQKKEGAATTFPIDLKKDKKHNKKKNLHSVQTVLLGSTLPMILVILWELLSRLGVFPSYQLPTPSVVLQTIGSMLQDGSLWSHVGITTFRVFAGFLIGTAVAGVLGSIVGLYQQAEQLFDPMIQACRSSPSLGWVPLFILWLGIGAASKVTMIAVGVFFPIYLNIVSGIAGVDRKLIEVGKMYGLNNFQMIRRVILP